MAADSLEGPSVMLGLRVACGAFLVAVLACDLTFDLGVHRGLPKDSTARDALVTMTEYYRHITRAGSPLATSVALAMTAMLASVGYELVASPKGNGVARCAVESSLAVGPIALAVMRTFPSARRLATGEGDVVERTELARSIARDHAMALTAMIAYVVMQIARV